MNEKKQRYDWNKMTNKKGEKMIFFLERKLQKILIYVLVWWEFPFSCLFFANFPSLHFILLIFPSFITFDEWREYFSRIPIECVTTEWDYQLEEYRMGDIEELTFLFTEINDEFEFKFDLNVDTPNE